jgi:hypothetical protein
LSEPQSKASGFRAASIFTSSPYSNHRNWGGLCDTRQFCHLPHLNFFMPSRWVEPAPPPPGDIDFLLVAFVVWVCGGWGGLKGMTSRSRWTGSG